MQTRNDQAQSLDRRTNPEPVRPEFETFQKGIQPPAYSWLSHPLLTKGGVTATSTTAILGFAYLAKHCLAHPTMGETARLFGCFGFGGLMLATVIVTARYVLHESNHAPDKASRKRPN
jgi:hypothetical protein